MDALTINPVEHLDSFRVSDKASELWNWITQWFLSLSERSMGTTSPAGNMLPSDRN